MFANSTTANDATNVVCDKCNVTYTPELNTKYCIACNEYLSNLNNYSECIDCKTQCLKLELNDGYCMNCDIKNCVCGNCNYCLELDDIGEELYDD